eukprot:NODE_1776_length_1070_cov_89.883448_g1448_i0.p1 GENE.NODE_1776_length_1070_cov_89.883448_g1448_i0~~NODE_1776_length_1070_cov_89.883448_g1448_i0.p1  ORF type:complete len:241 (-),score=37.97 NODE_1776_length_1070_cov_89.883448_g1448_i0:102-824(-)
MTIRSVPSSGARISSCSHSSEQWPLARASCRFRIPVAHPSSALDGILYSNTRMLERQGWRGMLIEGNPLTSVLLPTNRPKALNLGMAVCDTSRTVHFVYSGVKATGGIKEFMSEVFWKQWHADPEVREEYPVQCHRLDHVLSLADITHIDYFSLDVEGAEYEVLLTFDFAKVSVDVMIVEIHNTSTLRSSMIVELLQKHGLIFWKHEPLNSWFIQKDGPYSDLVRRDGNRTGITQRRPED